MLNIITHAPGFSKDRLKSFIRRITGKQGGPASVLQSLLRGLKQNGTAFRLNPPQNALGKDDTVHVLSGAEALRYAISLKAAGKIKKLIAGPNVAVFPSDYDNLLLDKNIDVLLQPADWTKRLWVEMEPSLEGKIRIWAAGVADPGK